jgi:hypothetical protein
MAKIEKAKGFVVTFMDEHCPVGIKSSAFNAKEWLIENVADCVGGGTYALSMGVNSSTGSYGEALRGFIDMRGSRPNYFGSIMSIEHGFSKNYEWESYLVTYLSNGLIRSETCIRMYDEVLALQLKLSIG